MPRISRKQKIAALGTSVAVVAGLGAAFAFVTDPNANNVSVTVPTLAELPAANGLDNTSLHLQPGETSTIYVRVSNTTDQTIVVNGIGAGASVQSPPESDFTPSPGATNPDGYCPAGSLRVAALGGTATGAGADAVTPVDPSDPPTAVAPQIDSAGTTDVAGPAIPSGDSAIYALQVTFDVADYAPTDGLDASVDPNNQLGCLTGDGSGANQTYPVHLGQLYYTMQG